MGDPPPGADVTVAVKVTDWPKVEGFGVAVRAVVLVALFTTCETAEEVEPLKLAIAAVGRRDRSDGSDATGRTVENVATPLGLSVPVPSVARRP